MTPRGSAHVIQTSCSNQKHMLGCRMPPFLRFWVWRRPGSVAECNPSCVSGYGGGQYSTVFTDPIHSRTNSTLAAKLYKAKQKQRSPDGPQMIPRWYHSESHSVMLGKQHSRVFVWVCRWNLSGSSLFVRIFVLLAYFRLFGFQKLFYMEKLQ